MVTAMVAVNVEVKNVASKNPPGPPPEPPLDAVPDAVSAPEPPPPPGANPTARVNCGPPTVGFVHVPDDEKT
jgi:hypothetical protein